MIAELLTAPASIAIDGQRWPLLITHGVLLHAERETGLDMLNSFRIVQANSAALRALLWASLARAGAAYSPRDLGAFLTLRNIGIVRRQLIRAWVSSMPERRSQEPEAGSQEKKVTHLAAWAFARWELGLSDAEWLDATPRQIQALSDVRLRRMQWEEMMVGILGAETVNHSFCRPEKARTPQSFMIHPYDDAAADEAPRDPGAYLLNQFLKVKGTKIVSYQSCRVQD
jgi:hypothetical protein